MATPRQALAETDCCGNLYPCPPHPEVPPSSRIPWSPLAALIAFGSRIVCAVGLALASIDLG